MLAMNIVISVNLLREDELAMLKRKRQVNKEAPYFLTMLMTCALSCATELTWNKALMKCRFEGKNPDYICKC